MFITSSNILLNRAPDGFEIGENENFAPENITDPDFSTFYVSTDSNRLTIDFGQTGNINYVAWAGANIDGNQDYTSRFTVRDGDTVIARNFVKYNNCCVITFPARSFTNLRVGMFNASGDELPLIRFVAAGVGFTVPNGGEVSGYNRQFLNRNYKSRSTLNQLAAPINYLQKKSQAKGVLSLPNMTKDFSENEWQDFLNFSVDNHFFIREQDPVPTVQNTGELRTNNNSAYLCYEVTNNKVTAHNSTRELNNQSINFKVFNGL